MWEIKMGVSYQVLDRSIYHLVSMILFNHCHFNPIFRGGGGLPPSGFSSATPRVINRGC